jgi:predicted  nucleic acid-binding Zn-ribbon protein
MNSRSAGILSVALGVPLLVANAVAQEAPAAKAVVQLPSQIVPTGEEDATPRAQDFAARAAQSERQSLEQKLLEMTSESTEGLETIRRDDGTIGINLEGRFQSVVIATPTEDGKYVVSCHTGEDARAHALHAAAMEAGKEPKLKPQALRRIATSQPQILEEK